MRNILIMLSFATVFSCTGAKINSPEKEAYEVLKANRGNILTIEESRVIKPKNLKMGYVYTLKYDYFDSDKITSSNISELVLSSIEDGAMIFDIPARENQEYKSKAIKVENAVSYGFYDGSFSKMYSIDNCLFVLGRCETKRFNGKTDYIETRYENGLWIKSSPAVGLGRRTEIYIFDKNGLVLYQLNKWGNSGTRISRIE